MNPEEESRIQKLLKASPPLTPPESFYRGVLQKIERKSEEETPRWYWGIPAKTFVTACALFVVVLAVRETKKSEPELFVQKFDMKDQPVSNKEKDQSRFDQKTASGGKPWLKQARDTSGGVATQGSFLQEQKTLAKERDYSPQSPPVASRSLVAMTGALSKDGLSPWQGLHPRTAVFQTVVVRSSSEWQMVWKDQNPPAIDFDHLMVVGIFAGNKPTAGYAVDIVDVKTSPNQITVTYRETSPPVGARLVLILTQPFDLQAISKTNLPITFQKTP